MPKDILTFTTPAAAGVSPACVSAFLDDVRARELALHSFIFLRHGKVFAEGYASPFKEGEFHRMYSVSKTFVSMAVGALIVEGKLSLDDKVADFFPDKCPPDLHPWVKEATVRDLLMMATPFTNQTYTPRDKDWAYTFFNTVPSHPAGTIFNYDTSGTYVLDVLVERLTGKPFLEYLKEKALLEIGFSPKSTCVKAPEGIMWGGSGVLCSSRDLARLAVLVSRDGEFEGKQLLPRDYVIAAKSKQIDNGPTSFINPLDGHGYGYQIWRIFENGYGFIGMGGQLALTFPDKDFIAVFTGDMQGHPTTYGGVFEVLKANVLDHLSDSPLDDDPAATAGMEKRIAAFDIPLPAGKKTSPYQEKVSGVSYKLIRNPMEITSFKLDLSEDEGVFRYQTSRGPRELKFGIGKYILTEFPEKNYSGDTIGKPLGRGYRTLAGASWREDHKLMLRVFLIDDYFGNLAVTFSFKGDDVGISMYKTAEWFLDEYQGFAGGRKV